MTGTAGKAGTADDALVGRSAVLVRIAELLRSAKDGAGGALVIEGMAGIGKTAVLARAIRSAGEQGFDVRSVTGSPMDAGLPYGVLSDLLRPELRDPSSVKRAPALAAAAGVIPVGDPPSTLAVASNVLELLSAAGRRRPVLVVVDDQHWADTSSVAVMMHIARSAVADRVVVLFGRRLGEPGPVVAGVEVVELGPLSASESRQVLVAGGCSPIEADRWVTRCGGLPLAMSEVARMPLGKAADPRLVADRLPEVFRRTVDEMEGKFRETLLLVALCGDLTILRNVEEPGFDAALRWAEDQAVVAVSDGVHAIFRHPLLQAAVVSGATASQERRAHQRLALALSNVGEVDRAAIHLASAADGADQVAANAMAALARRARKRGALSEAADAFAKAASLEATSDQRSMLLTEAADSCFDSGDSAKAFVFVEEAIRIAVLPEVRADARNLRARMSQWAVSPRFMVQELVSIADDMREIDAKRCSDALGMAAGAGYLDGDLTIAIRRGREAEQIALDAEDVIGAMTVSGGLAFSLFMAGEWEEYEVRAGQLRPFMELLFAERSWPGIHLAELFGTAWVCGEQWDLAEPLVRDLLHVLRTLGAKLSEASTSMLLGSLCFRQGRWDEAYALMHHWIDDADLPPVTLAWVRILVAQLTASLGDREETLRLVSEGMDVAGTADVPLVLAMGNAVLGHLALSVADTDTALLHLDRSADLLARIGFAEPEYFLWHGDHLGALVAAGRLGEVADRLVVLRKLADRGERRWLRGVIARVEATMSDDPSERAAMFEDALRTFEDLGMPFEVARTLLDRGAPQDRADARRLFRRLGARVWAERAGPTWDGRERRSGDLSQDREEAARILNVLTRSELNVALAVVSGRTNREIAAELHLSEKTIEHYLQHAYRKLGVKNRTGLATIAARSLAPPSR